MAVGGDMRIRIDDRKAIVRFASDEERKKFLNVLMEVWEKLGMPLVVRNKGHVKFEITPKRLKEYEQEI